MLFVILLWAATAVLEGSAYARLAVRPRFWRSLGLLLLACLLVVGIVVAFIYDWRIWLVASVVSLYRLVNIIRFAAARLPEPQLRSVSLRAHGWLLVLQTVATAVLWIVAHQHGGRLLLACIAAFQLMSSLVLLRASLHTWRHAEPFRRAQALTDKQLPSLSVLIPARNETDALEACLQALIASDYPKLEILVLDDNSVNRRTPEIIRSFAHDGVRFIQGEVPDEKNWLAKNQAYDKLRQEASGELLLFCGVDALFGPHTLRQLVEVLLYRQKAMLSVLPLKADTIRNQVSLLQSMRYYWELCLPRRFFKRPPVLSTCWLIRTEMLDQAGGFAAVARSVIPETYFARQAVVTDGYSFIRSNTELGLYSAKPTEQQYDTSVRVRYPQLHRRLELVALTSLLELLVFLGPIVGLCLLPFARPHTAYAMVWAVALAAILVTYYLAAAATKLNNALFTWALMPIAFAVDVIMVHVSLYKYEFSRVEWKGRDAAVPVMQVIPRLPKLP